MKLKLTTTLLAALLTFAPFGEAWAQVFPSPSIPVYGNWCGPDHPRSLAFAAAPVDALDAACMRHDYCFAAQGEFDCGCDIALLTELRNTQWQNPRIASDARGIYDAIALTPCSNPSGVAFKQSMFMRDLYADTISGRGTPLDVLERWRKLVIGK